MGRLRRPPIVHLNTDLRSCNTPGTLSAYRAQSVANGQLQRNRGNMEEVTKLFIEKSFDLERK